MSMTRELCDLQPYPQLGKEGWGRLCTGTDPENRKPLAFLHWTHLKVHVREQGRWELKEQTQWGRSQPEDSVGFVNVFSVATCTAPMMEDYKVRLRNETKVFESLQWHALWEMLLLYTMHYIFLFPFGHCVENWLAYAVFYRLKFSSHASYSLILTKQPCFR